MPRLKRVEPNTASADIYVGVDDLDSGNLHIRRWGKGSDVIGTTDTFRVVCSLVPCFGTPGTAGFCATAP